jgi:5-methylthioadenosine/S-adenosylhomocysteine deaminase
MDVLIKNATVVTGGATGEIINDGTVVVRGDKIVAVGSTAELESSYQNLEVIDGRGKAILPGFINSHTHTVLNVLRGTVEDMEVDSVYMYMTPITFAMNADERSAMAALSCVEAIRSGTTTLVDPGRFVPGYAQTMVDTGLRLYLSETCVDAVTTKIRLGIYEYSQEWGEDFLGRAVELIEGFHGMDNGRVQCHVAAHAPDNCSPWMLAKLNDLAQTYDLRRTTHLAQSLGEVEQVRKIAGVTPTEYLRDNDWLGDDVLAAHWSHCTESDIEILAESGVHIAHCPASGSRGGFHRAANMPSIVDAGVNVALGTDNMSEDMFDALRIGMVINRGKRNNQMRPTPGEMLDAGTINGAKAVGREADLGSLEVGKQADLMLINLRSANLVPLIHLLSNIVHYGQAGNVETLMVAGRILMRDGELTTMNEQDVLRNAQEATISSWKRLSEMYPDIPALEPAAW